MKELNEIWVIITILAFIYSTKTCDVLIKNSYDSNNKHCLIVGTCYWDQGSNSNCPSGKYCSAYLNYWDDALCINKLNTGKNCLEGMECQSNICGPIKCLAGPLELDEICSSSNQCFPTLRCVSGRCAEVIAEGQECSNDSDCGYKHECATIKDEAYSKCIRYFSLEKDAQLESSHPLLCKTGYMDDSYVCKDRNTEYQLQDMVDNLKTCSTNSDCSYSKDGGNTIQTGNDLGKFCSQMPYATSSQNCAILYCQYGGGEQFFNDLKKKYFGYFKYVEENNQRDSYWEQYLQHQSDLSETGRILYEAPHEDCYPPHGLLENKYGSSFACPEGDYLSTSSNFCESCDEGCLFCEEGEIGSSCIECESDYWFQKISPDDNTGNCQIECEDEYYFKDSTNKFCYKTGCPTDTGDCVDTSPSEVSTESESESTPDDTSDKNEDSSDSNFFTSSTALYIYIGGGGAIVITVVTIFLIKYFRKRRRMAKLEPINSTVLTRKASDGPNATARAFDTSYTPIKKTIHLKRSSTKSLSKAIIPQVRNGTRTAPQTERRAPVRQVSYSTSYKYKY